MKTASCKAKGRRLQNRVAEGLRNIYTGEPSDIKPTTMGEIGVDIQLSKDASDELGKLKIECKNVEKLNVSSVFRNHYTKYRDQGTPLLVHSKNNSEPLVTMTWATFLYYLKFEVDENHGEYG